MMPVPGDCFMAARFFEGKVYAILAGSGEVYELSTDHTGQPMLQKMPTSEEPSAFHSDCYLTGVLQEGDSQGA